MLEAFLVLYLLYVTCFSPFLLAVIVYSALRFPSEGPLCGRFLFFYSDSSPPPVLGAFLEVFHLISLPFLSETPVGFLEFLIRSCNPPPSPLSIFLPCLLGFLTLNF